MKTLSNTNLGTQIQVSVSVDSILILELQKLYLSRRTKERCVGVACPVLTAGLDHDKTHSTIVFNGGQIFRYSKDSKAKLQSS